MNDDLQVYFHGECVPNNPGGNLVFGFYIVRTHSGNVINESSFCLPEKLNNTSTLAEYLAVFEAFKWLYKKGFHKEKFIRFFGTSKEVYGQMNEKAMLFEGSYKEYAVRCLEAKNFTFWQVDFEFTDDNEPAAIVARREFEKTKMVAP